MPFIGLILLTSPFTGPFGATSGMLLLYDAYEGSTFTGDIAYEFANLAGSESPQIARDAGSIIEAILSGKGAVYLGIRAAGAATKIEASAEIYHSVANGALIVDSVNSAVANSKQYD